MERKGTIDVNGISLYYERRGAGPAVLLIPGATGDAGFFERVAGLLASRFTVVSYDRRGNSRSAKPVGWTTTSVEEQADDAAALIHALALEPAAVFGSSSGGNIALALALRGPQLVRGAVIHEPALIRYLEHPERAMPRIQEAIKKGIAKNGLPGGVEGFLRTVVGDATFDAIDPVVRTRLLGNGQAALTMEMEPLGHYLPSDEELRHMTVPVKLLVSDQSPPFFREIAAKLASKLSSASDQVGTIPGGHAPYFEHPDEVAHTLAPLLAAF